MRPAHFSFFHLSFLEIMKMNDARTVATDTLVKMAAELRADMTAIQHTNRQEALNLLRTYKLVTAEIHRRRNPAVLAKFN